MRTGTQVTGLSKKLHTQFCIPAVKSRLKSKSQSSAYTWHLKPGQGMSVGREQSPRTQYQTVQHQKVRKARLAKQMIKKTTEVGRKHAESRGPSEQGISRDRKGSSVATTVTRGSAESLRKVGTENRLLDLGGCCTRQGHCSGRRREGLTEVGFGTGGKKLQTVNTDRSPGKSCHKEQE